MITIYTLIVIVLAIFVFVRFIQVKSWENLVENKKKEFTDKGLKNKQSVRLSQVCASLVVVAIGINFINIAPPVKDEEKMSICYDSTLETNDMAMENEMAGSTDYDYYNDIWENNSDLNDYTREYKLDAITYLELNEPIESFEITSDDIIHTFDIYEIDSNLYVNIDNYQLYSLITRE